MLGQVRPGYAWLGQVWSGYENLCHDRLVRVRSG